MAQYDICSKSCNLVKELERIIELRNKEIKTKEKALKFLIGKVKAATKMAESIRCESRRYKETSYTGVGGMAEDLIAILEYKKGKN